MRRRPSSATPLRIPVALLPEAIGQGWLFGRASRVQCGSRSYAHDGRCLECHSRPFHRVVCDIEAYPSVSGHYLARQFGLTLLDFLTMWTELEVCAKLMNVSAISLSREALRDRTALSRRLPPTCTVKTGYWGDLVVAVGWEASEAAQSQEPA